MIVFSCISVNLSCFHRELQVFFQILEVKKSVYFSLMRSRVTEHFSKAGKVDPGDRVTLPVEILLVNLGYL